MIFQYQICSSLYLSQHVCMFLWYVAVRFGDMDVTIFFPVRRHSVAFDWFYPHFDLHDIKYVGRYWKIGSPTACLFAKEKLYIISFLFTNLIWAGNCKNFIKMKAKMIPKSHTVPQILRSSKADFLFDPDPMIFRSILGVERRRLCRRAETITSWVQWF